MDPPRQLDNGTKNLMPGTLRGSAGFAHKARLQRYLERDLSFSKLDVTRPTVRVTGLHTLFETLEHEARAIIVLHG